MKNSNEESRASGHANDNYFECFLEGAEFFFEEENYRVESANANEEIVVVFITMTQLTECFVICMQKIK